MGNKVIDWFLTNMPGLVETVGNMSELGVVVFALVLLSAFFISYNYLRFRLAPADYDSEHYEPWMDAELWEEV